MIVHRLAVIFKILRDIVVGDVFDLELLSLSLGRLDLHSSYLLYAEIGLRTELLDAVLVLVEDDEVDFESTERGQLHAFLNEVLRPLALGVPKLDYVSNLSWIWWHCVGDVIKGNLKFNLRCKLIITKIALKHYL